MAYGRPSRLAQLVTAGQSSTPIAYVQPDDFQRIDEGLDSLFYSWPRKVVHIDAQAIEAVGRVFRELIPPQATVLDLMSSWRSHWPEGHPKSSMIGLGLNSEEMAKIRTWTNSSSAT